MSKDYNVNILCEALKVAKETYYNHILRNKRENTVYAKRKAELKPVIEEIFYKSRETYGSSKITVIMKDRGYAISEKTLQISCMKTDYSVFDRVPKLYICNIKSAVKIF